jgi:HEAT repeat protein
MPDRRAVVIAGHTGDLAVARRAVADADPGVRVAALGALERLGALDAAAVERALTDDDATVRRRAAELAANHGDVSLIAALADREPDVVEMAAWACGEREPAGPAVIDTLVIDTLSHLATAHHDPLVREAAVAALGAIGDERGLAAILAATGDKPAVRRRAVIALAPFDGAEVDAALARALDDRDRQVRQAAEDLLAP